MNQATKKIIENFPGLEGKLKANEDMLLVGEAIRKLNNIEATFLKLAWFFEEPEHRNFDIALLYKHLDNEWLELALELIADYFKEDTFLIQEPTLSFVRKGNDDYYNQKLFADYLAENGLNYDKRKLNVYFNRGKLPVPDLELGGTSYWRKASAKKFCEQEKARLKVDG